MKVFSIDRKTVLWSSTEFNGVLWEVDTAIHHVLRVSAFLAAAAIALKRHFCKS